MRRDPGTMARPRATRNPAQKNRGPSRPNLSGFSLSRKPPICPGLLGCFLFPLGLSRKPSIYPGLLGCFLFPRHAQKNRGPSRPNLSGFGLSRKPPICPGLLGCFLFLLHVIPPRKTEAPAAPTFPALVSPANHPSAQDFWDASFFLFGSPCDVGSAAKSPNRIIHQFQESW